MKKKIIRTVAVILIAAVSISSLSAKESAKNGNLSFQQPFVLSPLADGLLGGTGVALSGSALLCDKVFKIKPSNFAGSPLSAAGVNGFDRAFMQSYNKTLDYVGDGVLALTMAAPLIMFTNPNSNWLTIGVMYAETLLLANGIKEWGKLLINRPRPYMYYENYPKDAVKDRDWHNSMPSGHTTIAFSAAAFTSAVFNDYFPDSPWRHVVTGVSFGLATGVGIFRMCSGNHFATDVLTGAAIGTLCGFAVPFFHSTKFQHKAGKKDNIEIAASPLGFNLAVKF